MSFNHYAKPLFAICASLFAMQTLAQSPTHNIDIEAQPLPGALQEFSEQTNLQLAYVATLANGKDSPGTQGETRPKAALSDILEGTELEYQYVNAKTVAIGSRRAEATGDSAPGGSQPAPEPILLAQSQETEQDEPGGDSDASSDDADASSDDAEVSDADVEEIIVTGTRLSRTPSQIAANLITMDEGVLRATGEFSLDKALRTLPQNQLAASSTASYARLGGQHFNGATNLSGASAVNLRGLGDGATLVLVDGKRIGSSGLAGGVTDISGIPTASIERVEVMLDGASAIYGSDAVGGVVNIITRKDYEGAELEVMHSVPGRGGFDESALTLSGSWLWGETRMRGNVQASSHSPLYGRDRPGKYDTNNYCKKGCFRGFRNVYEYQGTLYRPSQLPPGITTSSPGVTDIWLTELQPDGSLAVKVRSLTGDLTGQESTVDNQSLLPEQDRISAMLGFDHDFGATRLSAQAYYMDRTTTTDQGDARFANFLFPGPDGDNAFMYWSVSGIERLSTATQEVFRVNFDLTGSVFGMEWTFGAGATNDRSDNHHTGNFYASYDPDIPPHLADQFQAYEMASARPDYVEFIGIETFREFWGQELSSGWTNTTDWAEATLSGSWLSLPGGDARFVVGAAWRSTGLKTDNKRNAYGHNDNNGANWTEEPGLGIRFGVWDNKFVDENVGLFAEFAAPVLESLDLSAAVRWDDYNHFDSDTTYSIGAVWRPIGSVRLHSNLSTSYIIPTARDKVEDPNNFFIGQAFRCERNADWAELGGRDDCPGEPLRLQNPDGSLATTPGESFIYFSHLVYGGNPNLLPEQGESISVGVEFTPQAIPGLSLDLTWRSVDYTNKIVGSSSRDDVPHYVGVDSAEVYAFIFPDPSGSDAYYADRRNVNAAAWTNEGLDLEARYDWSTDWGSWSIDALITQTSSLYKDIGDGSEPYDYVGDVEANRRIWALVPEYRGMLSVGFDSADQRWSAWLSAVHTSVVSSTFSFRGEPLKVIHDEPLYVNLSGQYQVGERFGLLSNSVLSLRITNLFDDLAEHKEIFASSGELRNDGVVNAKFDDPRGRTFTLGLKMQF
jgi:iron complex outermembrane receptor protein